VRTEMYQSMALRRFGQSFHVSQKDLWLEGDQLERVESAILMNGQRQEVTAELGPDGLVVRHREGERTLERVLPAPRPVLGVYSAGRRIQEAVTAEAAALGAQAGSIDQQRTLSFQLFSPETGAVAEVDVAVLGPGELEDSLGNTHRGMLVEQRSTALPGVVTREIYGSDGSFRYSVSDVGVALELMRLGDGSGADPLDLQVPPPEMGLFDVSALTIPVAGLPARAGALCAVDRLRLRFRGQGLSALAEALRASEADLGGRGPRFVEELAARPETLLVELRAPEPPERLEPPQAGRAPGPLEDWVRDGFHLGLEDPRLQSLLDRCPQRETSCLERTVYRFLARKSLGRGFAGLDEILDSREGDCTEAALLLAALLRKSGVPARLAYGLLLTEAGLVGHAWTELWQGGRWHWLDPSFPGGAPYGLKLRLGVLDPAEPVWGQLGTTLLILRSGVRAEMAP